MNLLITNQKTKMEGEESDSNSKLTSIFREEKIAQYLKGKKFALMKVS